MPRKLKMQVGDAPIPLFAGLRDLAAVETNEPLVHRWWEYKVNCCRVSTKILLYFSTVKLYDVTMSFREYLKSLRESRGMNKADLARAIGVSNQYIVDIEAGRAKKPPTLERC